MTRICLSQLLLLLSAYGSTTDTKGAFPSPNNNLKWSFESALIETADGIYKLFEPTNTPLFSLADIGPMIDEVAVTVWRRRGVNPIIELQALRHVLKQLVMIVANTTAYQNTATVPIRTTQPLKKLEKSHSKQSDNSTFPSGNSYYVDLATRQLLSLENHSRQKKDSFHIHKRETADFLQVPEPPIKISETAAFKLTPHISFSDNNGNEYQLVGTKTRDQTITKCSPSECMLTDEVSKQVLGFEKPLSTEFLVLRNVNGNQLYTSGVQLCQDMDISPSPYQSTNLAYFLPHLRRKRKRKYERKTQAKRDIYLKRKLDQDIANIFRWKDFKKEFDPGSLRSLTPQQLLDSVSNNKKTLRNPRKVNLQKSRLLPNGAIKRYNYLRNTLEGEVKRVKRSKLAQSDDIFDLMPESYPQKTHIKKGQLSRMAERASGFNSSQDLYKLDENMDRMEWTTTPATPDEEINMVQPNTPDDVEEALVLNTTKKKRDETVGPDFEFTVVYDTGEPDYYIDEDINQTAQQKTSNEPWDNNAVLEQKEKFSPVEMFEKVADEVLFYVQNSNSLGPVLGQAVEPAPVLYNTVEKSHHKEYENVMRNLLVKVLAYVENIAKEDLENENCFPLDKELNDFLIELLGLPNKPEQQ